MINFRFSCTYTYDMFNLHCSIPILQCSFRRFVHLSSIGAPGPFIHRSMAAMVAVGTTISIVNLCAVFPFVLFVFYIILSFASSPSSVAVVTIRRVLMYRCVLNVLCAQIVQSHKHRQVTISLDLSLFNRKLSSVNDCFSFSSFHFFYLYFFCNKKD